MISRYCVWGDIFIFFQLLFFIFSGITRPRLSLLHAPSMTPHSTPTSLVYVTAKTMPAQLHLFCVYIWWVRVAGSPKLPELGTSLVLAFYPLPELRLPDALYLSWSPFPATSLYSISDFDLKIRTWVRHMWKRIEKPAFLPYALSFPNQRGFVPKSTKEHCPSFLPWPGIRTNVLSVYYWTIYLPSQYNT